MAKQLVNPLERHVEKAVVGVAGLILIGVIARFVVTSPNKMELGQENVTPATIDSRIAQKALSIQERLRQAQAEVEKPEPLADDFSKAVAPLRPDPLPLVASLKPEVPIVDRGGAKLGDAKLVTVLPLPKPAVTTGRTTWELRSTAPGGSTITQTSFTATNWVTVSSIIDVKAQSAQQRIDYMPALGDVYFGPMQLERRARRPNGAWSDEDWKAVENWPPVNPPRQPRIEFVETAGRFSAPRDLQQAVAGYLEAVSKPALQLDMLRPMPPYRSNGSIWKFPYIGGCESVLRQDDEFMFPNEPPAGVPQDRYGFCRGVAEELPEAAKVQAELDSIEKQIATAVQNLNPDMAVAAYNRAVELGQDPAAGAREKAKAQDLKTQASAAESDIRRKIRIGGAAPVVPGQAGPAKAAREKLPQQQGWVVDAGPASIPFEGVFQYRIRATLLNRWLGEPERFRNPTDAAVVFVTGAWSEPTDPIVIPPDFEFYVTGADEKDKQASIEMFRWYEGVWVQARRAKLGIGDRVAIESTCKVPSLDNPDVAEDAKVEFDGKGLLLDVDFDRTHREKRKGGGKAGVKMGPVERSTSVAYMDANGELQERWVTIDKGHPGKRSVAERLWKPK